jgi:hypothetical protein
MKYKIMEIVKPEILNNLLIKDRFETNDKYIVLKNINCYPMKIIHNSVEEAYTEITKCKDILKDMNLTIIPYIRIDYEGEVL